MSVAPREKAAPPVVAAPRQPRDSLRRVLNRQALIIGLVAVGAAIGIGLLVYLVVYRDLFGVLGHSRHWVRGVLQRQGHMSAFGLLYIEESGIPLPAPGDVFVMYIGAHVPHTLPILVAAWLGLIASVVLGSTNLYLISRKLGRRVVDMKLARVMHLTPSRLHRAEGWFAQYGVLAIIFGRHIPGFRVPITVAAGVFKVRYRVFAPAVAVSTAIWAGVFLFVGVMYGGRVEGFLRAHRGLYWLVGILVAVVAGIVIVRHLRSLQDPEIEAE